jgi:hypothetical protein
MSKVKQQIWKDIEGYEGIYQVSNLGVVLAIGVASGLGTGINPTTLFGDGGSNRNLVLDARPTIA